VTIVDFTPFASCAIFTPTLAPMRVFTAMSEKMSENQT
jgi:hypothetical protein